jgi:hypothetical protein
MPGLTTLTDFEAEASPAEHPLAAVPSELPALVLTTLGCADSFTAMAGSPATQIAAYFAQTDPLQLGVSTGWPALDRFYRVAPGELTIVSGVSPSEVAGTLVSEPGYAAFISGMLREHIARPAPRSGVPNSGKSEWLDALLVNLAENHGWAFAAASMEKSPMQHLRALIEKRVRKPFRTSAYNGELLPPMGLDEVRVSRLHCDLGCSCLAACDVRVSTVPTAVGLQPMQTLVCGLLMTVGLRFCVCARPRWWKASTGSRTTLCSSATTRRTLWGRPPSTGCCPKHESRCSGAPFTSKSPLLRPCRLRCCHQRLLLSFGDTWTLVSVPARRHGVRGLVIDPYNELDSHRDRNTNETDFIKDVLNKVRPAGSHAMPGLGKPIVPAALLFTLTVSARASPGAALRPRDRVPRMVRGAPAQADGRRLRRALAVRHLRLGPLVQQDGQRNRGAPVRSSPRAVCWLSDGRPGLQPRSRPSVGARLRVAEPRLLRLCTCRRWEHRKDEMTGRAYRVARPEVDIKVQKVRDSAVSTVRTPLLQLSGALAWRANKAAVAPKVSAAACVLSHARRAGVPRRSATRTWARRASSSCCTTGPRGGTWTRETRSRRTTSLVASYRCGTP